MFRESGFWRPPGSKKGQKWVFGVLEVEKKVTFGVLGFLEIGFLGSWKSGFLDRYSLYPKILGGVLTLFDLHFGRV